MRTIIIIIFLLLTNFVHINAQRERGIYNNPLLKDYVADPNILTTKNIYYLFSTGKEIPYYYSDDLVTWKKGEILWNKKSTPFVYNNLWAPHFIKINNKYFGYVSAWLNNSKTSYTFVISSDYPNRDYKFIKPLLTVENTGVTNPIDPFYYEENQYNRWIFFGSCYGIYCIQLSDCATRIKEDASPILISSEGEGAYIKKIDEWYYLLFSVGEYWNYTYSIKYGRSKSIFGPYYDKNGFSLTNGGGEILLKSNKNDRFYGPGHNGEIIKDKKGHYYITYHCHDRYENNHQNLRQLMISEISIDNDKWLTIIDEKGNPTIKPTQYFRLPILK